MKLTGQKLKEKRESVHLTISEVSLNTKINPKVLHAMEEGDANHLPAKTFLRGFVRSYASYLKMNVDEVLATFNDELGEPPKEAVETAPVQETSAAQARADVNGEGSGSFRMFLVGSIVVLIVMIIGVRSLVQKYERERSAGDTTLSAKVVPIAAAPTEKAPEPASQPVAEVKPPETSVANTEAAKPAEASAPKLSIAAIETPKAAPPPVEHPAVDPTAKTKPSVVPKSVDVAAATPKAEPVVAPAEPKPASVSTEEKPKATKIKGKAHHQIILEALDKVDVMLEVNGRTKKISLGPNQVHTIVAEGPIKLDVSDGGALNITDNGRDKGTPGNLGQPKQITIP